MYKVRNYDIKLVDDGSVPVNGKWQKVDESLHARTENGRTEYVYITRSDSICHLYHGKMPVEHLDWMLMGKDMLVRTLAKDKHIRLSCMLDKSEIEKLRFLLDKFGISIVERVARNCYGVSVSTRSPFWFGCSSEEVKNYLRALNIEE